MQILKFVKQDGQPIGIFTWFAVHCTSMNNSNRLVSGDNKGYASYLFEKAMNPNALPGKVSYFSSIGKSELISHYLSGCFCCCICKC